MNIDYNRIDNLRKGNIDDCIFEEDGMGVIDIMIMEDIDIEDSLLIDSVEYTYPDLIEAVNNI